MVLLRLLAVIAVVLLCQARFAAADGHPLANLDAHAEQSLRFWKAPGMMVSVVKDDAVVQAKGYGVRRLGAPDRVDERTLFSIGSTSKAFAAATVAVLVGDGEVAWTDPVRQYLPWLQVYDEYVARQLTVRDMLSGTLGTWYNDENRLRRYAKDSRDILERGKAIKPKASFRSGFVYTNNMFIASGMLVEEVAGTSWNDFARERLWRPLGMASTTASADEAWASGNAAQGHRGKFNKLPKPQPYEYCDEVCVPSGGVNTNAVDIAQWLRFQLGDGSFAGQTIIESTAFAEMHRPQSIMRPVEKASGVYVPFPSTDLDRWGVSRAAYGFGWGMFDYKGKTILWHSGGANYTASYVLLVPEDALGIFVSTNRYEAKNSVSMAMHILDAYLGGEQTDWNQAFFAEKQKN
ncbi:MAG: serine hydrolase domain-containing protein [Pseudomonadota bacterium]